ncbi:PD-(D/E)XK nuclease family protein [Kamptonema sp. UHCC 0994]|uniref:PD-(D/E)XK nuclease family protein n=1 Tax=Kamptonema sp. UHCC 0994 TaxID=3031329 RepID=UPI0023B960EA|nr:PD-(D/E)XK nuclease family protein [Kamptonema sp. UHCC 0994]MDF0553408.1 PD-(D/E)XK nuclease family protein [Kamptonema sp. UHCC 0994]
MNEIWRRFASYNLWLQFEPPVGQEIFHCDMKRGFIKARKGEPEVAKLLTTESPAMRIGHLAQRGVYEFHQHPQMLGRIDAVEEIAEIIQLNQELAEVQERVIFILTKYHQQPILLGKKIIEFNRGDEGFPPPIFMKQGTYRFKFYAAIDCIFAEPDGTLHILDFKTGKSDFDVRQAYLYLLAVSYLYPNKPAIASFYNLETGKQSDPISAKANTLEAFKIEMSLIAKRHLKELKLYEDNPAEFSIIFPPNPGFNCQYCLVNSICNFSAVELEVAA